MDGINKGDKGLYRRVMADGVQAYRRVARVICTYPLDMVEKAPFRAFGRQNVPSYAFFTRFFCDMRTKHNPLSAHIAKNRVKNAYDGTF